MPVGPNKRALRLADRSLGEHPDPLPLLIALLAGAIYTSAAADSLARQEERRSVGMYEIAAVAAINLVIGAILALLAQGSLLRRLAVGGSVSIAEVRSAAATRELAEDDLDAAARPIEETEAGPNWTPAQHPELARAAAASMFAANERLQAELDAARGELQRERTKVESLCSEARTDALTGLPNRRSFDEELNRRFDQWRRHDVPVSLLLIDIDRFKQVNDQHGHPAGDAVLRWIARLIRDAFREMDVPARYGGEEFATILPGTQLSDAANVAERLRAAIAARVFQDGDLTLPVTVSIGVATSTAGDDPAKLIERTDEALYAAKQNGRNRAYLNDRNGCAVIEFDRSVVRHQFQAIQHIAPYYGAPDVPPPEQFVPVRCGDISEKGISFVCDQAPECKAFVVRLGTPPHESHMVATIANITSIVSDGEPQFRVGCSFVARIGAAGKSNSPSGEPVAAC
jgi:diguanylate cyclase (GGDEF)-like protein